MNIFKLAGRNIWRNKRRTLITAAAITFAVFFAIFMQSVNKGIFDNMEHGMISSYIGYAHIHSNGYWEDQSLDYAFPVNENINAIPSQYKDIDGVIPRLESFALASNEAITRGTLVVGIHPKKDDEMTNLSQKVTKGEFLNGDEHSVLLAEGLAELLKIKVGDTLTLTSQGYHGVNAAGLYPVKGLLKFPSPELNNQMVYMTLTNAQQFYGAEGLVTSVVLNTNKPNRIEQAVSNIAADLGEQYEVMDYKKLIPDLIQAREFKEAGGLFMLFILYSIITFGIFGTILMMLKERQYEFGVLTAIGMKRSQLSMVVWLETVFLGLIGAIGGILLGIPLAYGLNAFPIQLKGEMAAAYEDFGIEPLIMTATDSSIFFNQALTVFIIVAIIALYPIRKIYQLKPVEAMRN